MGVGPRQRAVRLYRGQIPSPGRPTVAWREDRVRFWAGIARGLSSEEAAAAIGVSQPVGTRWFRHAGGVGPSLCAAVSGRYLSFAEREDIAIWRAGRGCSRHRPATGPLAVDDLAGAAAQRVDTHVSPGLPRVDGAVARRAASATPEGREAGNEQAAAAVRAGPARRRDPGSARQVRDRPGRGAVEGT